MHGPPTLADQSTPIDPALGPCLRDGWCRDTGPFSWQPRGVRPMAQTFGA